MKTKGLRLSGRSALFAALAGLGMTAVQAQVVTPPTVDATLPPGGSVDVDKSVATPELPPVLDLCLMIDLSGSYRDDLVNIKALAPSLFDDVRAGVDDSQFCVTSFIDFPVSPWGGSLDYAYNRNLDMTADKTAFTTSINSLSARGGSDGPESQYEALYQAATGLGRDIPPGGPSTGDVPADLDPTWRTNATRVVAITTDAPFHNSGDAGPFPYPGPSSTDTIDALNAAGIRVIALKAPGSSIQMNEVADETSGAVVTTTSSSSDIADAILEGLGNLPITVTPVPVGCDPLEFYFSPTSRTVTSGDPALFAESVGVPNDSSLEGESFHCTVEFRDDNGNSLGSQEVWIDVADVTPPQASCGPGVNPAGHEPKASTSNEDGFFLLSANDNVDDNPLIYLTDTGSGTVFGPFADGTNIKYTQAPGGAPSIEPGSGYVDWKIKGTGDFTTYAVDASGNTSDEAACYVPPLPK